MKKNQYTLNTILTIIVGVALLAAVLIRTFVPRFILPQLDIPNIMLLSLLALLLDHYIAPGAKRCYICIPVFAVLTFGILPVAAGFAGWLDAWKPALLGGVVFTAATWLFTSITDRISTGPVAKAAPILSALGLYLAAQCFMGLF